MSKGNRHCCVPCCTNDDRKNASGSLSFHRIPIPKNKDDKEKAKLQKEWIIRIRRDIGPDFKVV